MRGYIALIDKQLNSDYGVVFPDFPGCVTAGTTFEDAREMAKEALALHLEGMEEIPEPSSFETIMADPDNRDAIVMLVEVPLVLSV
jgi:predicted RNase H-like HicB family nuclease